MIRNLSIALAAGMVALVVACASTSADAQQPLPKGGFLGSQSLSSASVDYSGYSQGDSITSGGQTYVVLSDVRAVPSTSGEQPSGEVLEHKGQFVVYRETRPAMKSPSPVMTQDASLSTAGQPLVTHAVVLNPATGRVGVVMGTIKVKLADMSQTDSIAAAQGLRVSTRFDHLNVVFLEASTGQDIAVATAALRADPRVTSADPEILENVRVPN